MEVPRKMTGSKPPTDEVGHGSDGQGAGFGVRSPVPHELHPTAQKILAAAKKILRERGYQGMTLQAISAEAQVNKAGVWYYFGGKQQLLHALLEDAVIRESRNFGAEAPATATAAERVDLIIGSADQLADRLRRFATFYELLPEATRDEELHHHLMTMYRSWYAWADEVLAPTVAGSEVRDRRASPGQFASLLLDGIFLQMMIAGPEFDLEAALRHARQALRQLLEDEGGVQR